MAPFGRDVRQRASALSRRNRGFIAAFTFLPRAQHAQTRRSTGETSPRLQVDDTTPATPLHAPFPRPKVDSRRVRQRRRRACRALPAMTLAAARAADPMLDDGASRSESWDHDGKADCSITADHWAHTVNPGAFRFIEVEKSSAVLAWPACRQTVAEYAATLPRQRGRDLAFYEPLGFSPRRGLRREAFASVLGACTTVGTFGRRCEYFPEGGNRLPGALIGVFVVNRVMGLRRPKATCSARARARSRAGSARARSVRSWSDRWTSRCARGR